MSHFFSEILDASYRGVPFHCQATGESVSRALAVYEYPFRDGGELDDMGRRAIRYRIDAIFFGSGYKAAFDRFIFVLNKGGEGELIHPVHGLCHVMVENYSVEHSAETPDSCTINVTFVESGQKNPFFFNAITPLGKAFAAVKNVTSAIHDAVSFASSVCVDIIEAATFFAPNRVLANISYTLSELTRSYEVPQDFRRNTKSYVLQPNAFLVDMRKKTATSLSHLYLSKTSPALAWRGINSSFPQREVTTDTDTNELASINRRSLFSSSSKTQKNSIKKSTPTSKKTIFTTYPPKEKTYEITQPTTFFLANLIETEAIANLAGEILLDETKKPVLHPHEVESIVADTRMRIQNDIEDARRILPASKGREVTEKLRDAALHIQILGTTALQAKPPLQKSIVENLCNHHLLAHKMHNDYTRAQEILRLNPGIHMPNTIQKGTSISHYLARTKEKIAHTF